VDSALLGQTAAKCMEAVDGISGELLAVGIVVVIDTGDDETLTRTYSSRTIHFENLGLFEAACDVVRHGELPDDD
jgi:hypothetical protein